MELINGGGGESDELNEEERQKLIQHAHEVEKDIIRAQRGRRTAELWLAGRLYEFCEERMWELLSYETLEEFLASPDIEIKRSQVFRYVRVHREYVVVRKVPLGNLEGIPTKKLDMVLAAIKDGRVIWQDAVADCRSLTYKDLEIKYAKADPNGPINPDEEPELAQCPTCGSWVDPAKLEDEAA